MKETPCGTEEENNWNSQRQKNSDQTCDKQEMTNINIDIESRNKMT